MRPLRQYYFRAELRHAERIPDEPTMLVGNHDGGTMPVDGLCLASFWYDRFGSDRPLFWLVHDVLLSLAPPLTHLLARIGFLRAGRNHLDAVLDQHDSLFVYPGGGREAFRPFWERRQISLGHRTGFIANALRRRVPITPIASVGAHETFVVLLRGTWLAHHLGLPRALRADVMPLWLGLPWGVGFGAMPHLPLPSKIVQEVLEPVQLWRELGETADAADPAVLRAGFNLVRGRIQAVTARLYDERRWPMLG